MCYLLTRITCSRGLNNETVLHVVKVNCAVSFCVTAAIFTLGFNYYDRERVATGNQKIFCLNITETMQMKECNNFCVIFTDFLNCRLSFTIIDSTIYESIKFYFLLYNTNINLYATISNPISNAKIIYNFESVTHYKCQNDFLSINECSQWPKNLNQKVYHPIINI